MNKKDNQVMAPEGNDRPAREASAQGGQEAFNQAPIDSEPSYRAIFELASVGMAQANPKTGRWLRVNKAFCEITGYSAAELYGMCVPEITHPDDRQADWDLFQRVVSGELPNYQNNKRYVCKDGSIAWVNVNMTILRDEAGRPTCTVASIENITERKRAEEALRESEERYRSLFDDMTEGFAIHELITDDAGQPVDYRFLDINPAFERLTGLKHSATVGRTHNELLSDNDSQWVQIYGGVALTGNAVQFEKYSPALKRHYQVFAYRPAPRQFATLFLDITERKRAGEALREAHEQLELRVRQRTADLAAANAALQQEIAERREIEAALRESEGRYRVLFEQNMDAIFLARPDGKVTGANPAACAMFGMSEEELCRVGRQGIVDPDDPRIEALLEERARSGKIKCEISTLRRDGTRFISELNSVILPGDPPRAFVIVRDITERKQAEKALRESREILELAQTIAHLGGWLMDIENNRVTWSDEVYRIYGLKPRECAATYEAFLERVHPDDLDAVVGAYQDALREGCDSYELEHRIIRKDTGEIRFVNKKCEFTRDASGRPIRLAGVVHDITERKRTEEALAVAIAELKTIDRRKDEFLAMLAHELRNPLAPVYNAIKLLSQDESASEFTRRQHTIIDRQVTHMARLLDDLLDVSRITHGKVELKTRPLAISEVLTQAVEISEPLIQSRGHQLHVAVPPDALLVEGDPDRLAQSIGNLLSNAAKYTEAGGRIWLKAAREGGEAVVRVRDSGMGISPEIMPRIFDLFAQADHSLDRAQGGLGIGLTLVKSLIEMHRGTLAVHSDGPGKGSEFTIRLPALEAAEIESAAPPRPAASADAAPACRRVLVVDDIADTARSMVELLESWGHAGQAVFDGHSALGTVRTFQPDVVLLDIGLPGMNGYEVARSLRANYGGALMLVALTGYGQESDRRLALEAGFDDHLTKPVDLAALRELLAHGKG